MGPIAIEEIKEDFRKLKEGKAPGDDNICPEMLKAEIQSLQSYYIPMNQWSSRYNSLPRSSCVQKINSALTTFLYYLNKPKNGTLVSSVSFYECFGVLSFVLFSLSHSIFYSAISLSGLWLLDVSPPNHHQGDMASSNHCHTACLKAIWCSSLRVMQCVCSFLW